MQSLYPFKLRPLFMEKIWGGQKIHSILNIDFGSISNCGEAWLLSGVEGNPTIVDNGYLADNELNELVEVFMGDLVGEKVYERFGNRFPILVKLIDTNDWLSIQVHPDDAMARQQGEEAGKTEMWYILQADENAQLINGFNQNLESELYLNQLKDNKLEEILNFEPVTKGDVFYIPAGRLHALGPGMLLAEIQQTSDITYRIYDWNRVDKEGKTRELHTEQALEALRFEKSENTKTPYDLEENRTAKLVDSEYFTTNILEFTKPLKKDYSDLDSFVILLCTEGELELKWEGTAYGIRQGELILLPQIVNHIELYPKEKSRLLEVYIS